MKTRLLRAAKTSCRKLSVVSLVASMLVISSGATSAEVQREPAKGKVALFLKAERDQPCNGPVVLEITLTNLGSEDIQWWCGGPARYPKASDFAVEASYLGHKWTLNSKSFSNGQYEIGSGIGAHLAPGESIQAPLAVIISVPEDVKLPPGMHFFDHIHLHVSTVDWETDQPPEVIVSFKDDKKTLDERRTQLIKAITSSGPPFWLHMAQTHADPVVTEALLKLANIDVEPMCSNAREALALQPSLPESAGKDLAALVRKKCTPGSCFRYHSPAGDFFRAALKTQAQEAREAVLDYLKTSNDPETCKALYSHLVHSPGDVDWYRHAQQAIMEQDRARPIDAATSREAKNAVDSLERSIKYGER